MYSLVELKITLVQNEKFIFFRKGQILTIYLLSRWDGSIAFGATTKTPSLRADGQSRQQHPYS